MQTSLGVKCSLRAAGAHPCAFFAVAELEAQLGIAEKTLAEFIIDVAKGSKNVDGFKKVSTSRY
jgi:hypothetical protein